MLTNNVDRTRQVVLGDAGDDELSTQELSPTRKRACHKPGQALNPANEEPGPWPEAYGVGPYTLEVSATNTNSRVENQFTIKLSLSHLPSGVRKVHFPKHTISRHYFCTKPPSEPSLDTLELDVVLVCTSAMRVTSQKEEALQRAKTKEEGEPVNTQKGGEVRICDKCIVREKTRASRKTLNSQDDDAWSKDAALRVIIFNTEEVKDWALQTLVESGARRYWQVEAPMRIACCCRHHAEKEGFQIIFTLTDYLGNTIAQTLSKSIMISGSRRGGCDAGSPDSAHIQPPDRVMPSSCHTTVPLSAAGTALPAGPPDPAAAAARNTPESPVKMTVGAPQPPNPAGAAMKPGPTNTKPATQPTTVQPLRREINTDLFDAHVYAQQGAQSPPRGIILPARPVRPRQQKDRPKYLNINPHIHWPQPHSKAWHIAKQAEIEARGRKKANFGRGLRSLRRQQQSGGWETQLPDKILENPAWMRVLRRLKDDPALDGGLREGSNLEGGVEGLASTEHYRNDVAQ